MCLVRSTRVRHAVWGPEDKTNMISVMHDIRKAVAPGECYFADPGCHGDKGKLHAAVQSAGFRDINIRSGSRCTMGRPCCMLQTRLQHERGYSQSV